MANAKKAQEYTITKRGIEFEHKVKGNVVISEEEIRMLARLHCPKTDMERYFGVDHQVIEKHFGDIIKEEQSRTKQKLRAKQIEMALEGNVPMLIWLGKNILEQSETGVKNDDAKQPLPWDEDNF